MDNIVVGHGGKGVARSLMAAALAIGVSVDDAERSAAEEAAGAAPVGEVDALVAEKEQERVRATIALVERMNVEMDKNESLRNFLVSLHGLILKTGKPIPRSALLKSGVSKKDLNRLSISGFISETFLRHERTQALHACIRLPQDVTFYGKRAAAVVKEADVKPEEASRIREDLGGVYEVVDTANPPANTAVTPVGD